MTSGPQIQIATSPQITTQVYSNVPSSLLINITANNVNQNENPARSIIINGNSWNAIINITPQLTYYVTYSLSSGTLTESPAFNYTGTDVTVTVQKKGITSLASFIVYPNIQQGSTYSVDLLDPAYGLNSVISYPATITYSLYNPTSDMTATATARVCLPAPV